MLVGAVRLSHVGAILLMLVGATLLTFVGAIWLTLAGAFRTLIGYALKRTDDGMGIAPTTEDARTGYCKKNRTKQ